MGEASFFPILGGSEHLIFAEMEPLIVQLQDIALKTIALFGSNQLTQVGPWYSTLQPSFTFMGESSGRDGKSQMHEIVVQPLLSLQENGTL
jgi:hypothetical protein